MGKFALRSALPVVALLMCFPAGAEEPKALSRNPELLEPSPNNAKPQGFKILGYACKDVLFVKPRSEAADQLGDMLTEGRGKIVKFAVHVIAKGAEMGLCDALVVEPAMPELDNRKSIDFSSTRPLIYEQITGANTPVQEKTPGQELCAPDQFYNANGHVCVGLQVIPNCQPGQSGGIRPCADASSLAGSGMPSCPDAQFFSALEKKCVPLMASGLDGAGCRADERKVLGTCIPRSLR
jgi:hypothetical protein